MAPIVLFTYNRLNHTKNTVSALKKNYGAKESHLIIYSDGPKNIKDYVKVKKIREYIKTINGFKKVNIIERDRNWGLANSIIDGVTKIVNEYGKVIVLEDDLVTSPNFLDFMNQALDVHRENKKIMSVTGYSFPINLPVDYSYDVYLFYRCMSWGWGTWKDRWKSATWSEHGIYKMLVRPWLYHRFRRGGKDLPKMLLAQSLGKIDSWAIRWCFNHMINNAFCLYPNVSFIHNEGFDNSGTHKTPTINMNVNNLNLKDISVTVDLEINDYIAKQIQGIQN